MALAVLCVGGLAVSLSQTLVVPVQGRLPELLDAAPAATGWVLTVSLLVGSVSMPISGRLADLFGRRAVLLVSTSCLILGSLVCAVAPSLEIMLVGRAVQGLAMGFIPVAIATVRDVRPPAGVAAGVGAVSATLGLGGGLGLPLAAWVAQQMDWRALFWGSAALGMLLFVGVLLGLPAATGPQGRRARVDLLGAVGLALGVTAALLGVSRAPLWGWTDPRSVGLVVIAAIVLSLWAWLELRVPDPLCDLRLASRPSIALTNLASAMLGASLMCQVVAVPQFLQLPSGSAGGMGMSLVLTGILLVPACLVMSLCAPVAGRLTVRWGSRTVLLAGTFLVTVGHAIAVVPTGGLSALILSGCVMYAGVGVAYAAVPTIIMSAVTARESGASLGLNALVRSFGSTVASAVAASIIATSVTSAGLPSPGSFRVCFVVGAALGAAAMLCVWCLPRARRESVRDAAPGPEETSTKNRLVV